MNVTTLINAVRDAIASDSAVNAWCRANYSRAHTVYKGADMREPPADTEYPIVHVFPVRKNVGYELGEQDHLVGVTCGINNVTQTADIATIEDSIRSGSYSWTESGSGTNEFFCENPASDETELPNEDVDNLLWAALGPDGPAFYAVVNNGVDTPDDAQYIHESFFPSYATLGFINPSFTGTCSSIKVRYRGRTSNPGLPGAKMVFKIYDGDTQMEDSYTTGILTGDWTTYEITWSGLSKSAAEMSDFRVRVETIGFGIDMQVSEMEAVFTVSSASRDPAIDQPDGVKLNDAAATQGTPGSLAAGEWGWGDNDSLGFNTVYVRLIDGSDPDDQAAGYVEATYYVSVKSYDGVDDLESFRKLVETAVTGAGLGTNAFINLLGIVFEEIEGFPFMLVDMDFNVAVPFSQGDDAFA